MHLDGVIINGWKLRAEQDRAYEESLQADIAKVSDRQNFNTVWKLNQTE